jgi:Ca2+-binding RTX toxin-like protein
MGRTILFATLAPGSLAFVGGTAFAAVVRGTPGADDLAGGNAPDTLLGGPGKDSLDGRGGDDLLRGEEGDDTFTDLAGDDAIAVPGFGPGPPGLPLEPDAIACGPGRDRAIAHTVDDVAGDCEEVGRLGSGN